MAVSGTTTFTVSGQDVVLAALRKLGAYGPQDVVPAAELTTALFALNVRVKELAIHGLPLWKVVKATMPTVAGQSAYNLSTATGTTLPLKLLSAVRFDTISLSQIVLPILSRYDFDLLGMPSQSGPPTQVWYDPKLGAGVVNVYPVPADTTNNIIITAHIQIDDFGTLADTPDFPQEAFLMLVWVMADELALEYSTDARVRAEIKDKAMAYQMMFFNSLQEQASIIFTPSRRG